MEEIKEASILLAMDEAGPNEAGHAEQVTADGEADQGQGHTQERPFSGTRMSEGKHAVKPGNP